MKIIKTGVCGTMESSDVLVTLEPGAAEGIVIELNSTVEKQFGKEIRRVINETLEELEITSAKITAVDKGALDCAIRARVKTAAYRASEGQPFQWGGASK